MLKRAEHKQYATVFWVLSVVCMGVIFYLSSRTADQSSRESGAVLAWLTRLLGDGRLTDFLVRKSAHFLEYTGLCLLLSFACAATWGRRYTAVSLPIASRMQSPTRCTSALCPGVPARRQTGRLTPPVRLLDGCVPGCCCGCGFGCAIVPKSTTRIDIAAKSYII